MSVGVVKEMKPVLSHAMKCHGHQGFDCHWSTFTDVKKGSKHHRAGHVICGLYRELGRLSDELSSLAEAAMLMKQKVGY